MMKKKKRKQFNHTFTQKHSIINPHIYKQNFQQEHTLKNTHSNTHTQAFK